MTTALLSKPAPSFVAYRREATALAMELLRQGQPGEFDEQALPAYSHPNLLMRWLFWQRLRKVTRHLHRTLPSGARVLDFGCGVGMLLPLLAAQGHRLTGVDLDVRHTAQFLEHFGVTGATVLHADQLGTLTKEKFDAITALDVLEHVDDLEATVGQLARLIRPGGKLIVCGPTENVLYRIGRKLAGFSGHYHVRNIAAIHDVIRLRYPTSSIATLYPGLPLFRLFEATRTPAPKR
jgi:SAM-dependent methyltransferase